MPYHEPSFLNGLACGLTATNGRQLSQGTYKTLLTGISRVTSQSVLGREYDTFISRVYIQTDSPVSILYEYGPADAASLTRELRKVPASAETQTVYHVRRIPEAVSMRNFRYSAYILERADMQIRFDARFMSYPYPSGAQILQYPGSPEQVTSWWVRSIR